MEKLHSAPPAAIYRGHCGVSAYPAGATSYVVKRGDSLWSLSVKFGASVEEIMKANGLTDRAFIWTGERLVTPQPR